MTIQKLHHNGMAIEVNWPRYWESAIIQRLHVRKLLHCRES